MNPKHRPSFEKIKNNDWYKGEIYTDEELKQVMSSKLASN